LLAGRIAIGVTPEASGNYYHWLLDLVPRVLLLKYAAQNFSNYDALRGEQRRSRKRGLLMGIGLAAFIDKAGTGPSGNLAKRGGLHGGWESAVVRVHSDGKVTIFAGSHSRCWARSWRSSGDRSMMGLCISAGMVAMSENGLLAHSHH
jgi:hypothetical protein